MKIVIDFRDILKTYGIELTHDLSDEQKQKVTEVLLTQMEYDELVKELNLIVTSGH